MSVPTNEKAFMERVVAWPGSHDEPGYINLHWTVDGKSGMRGRAYKDPDDFMSMVQWLLANPLVAKDIYFCLSTQQLAGKEYNGHLTAARGADSALKFKAIWIDIDVKPDKPDNAYVTLADAVSALGNFVRDATLPDPSAIVESGGGLHVYWISHRALSRFEWTRYAEGLRAEIDRLGLKCDAGLTTDAARVLRIPGTFNRKIENQPRPVVLDQLGVDYDFAATPGLARLGSLKPFDTAAATKSAAPRAPTYDLSKFAGYVVPAELGALDPRDSLSAGIEQRRDMPLKIDGLVQCPHFLDALKSGGAGYSQGLWMQDVLAATWFEKPRPLAHALSRGHKGYTPADTNAMFDRKMADRETRNLGWPGCQAFENAGCKLCAGCMQKGKIKSPLNLAVSYQAPPAQPSFVDPYAEFAGPAFPLDVLPPTMAKFVDAEHCAMGADPSAIAMAALTAAAGAMHARTQIRAAESWWEKPILWIALVGQPSTMKSPIIDKATKTLSGVDHARDSRWRQEYRTWQQQNKK